MHSNSFLTQDPESQTEELSTTQEIKKEDKESPSRPLLRLKSPPKVLYSVGALRNVVTPEIFKKIPDEVFGKLEQEEMKPNSKLAVIVKQIMQTLDLDKKNETSKPTTLKDLQKLTLEPQSHYNKWQDVYHKLKSRKTEQSTAFSPPTYDRGLSLGKEKVDPVELKITGYKNSLIDYCKNVVLGDQSYSVAEIRGHRPEQQDCLTTSIIQKDERKYNAAHNFDKLTVEQRKAVFKRTVAQMQENYGKNESEKGGTTLNSTIAWIDNHNNLQMSNINLGDSTTYYFILNAEGKLVECELLNTNLHKPSDPEEKARIEAAGGVVTTFGYCPRLDGAIAISRSIGDNEYVPHGFSHDPEPWNKIRPLKPGEEAYVVVGCDGLTEAKNVTTKLLGETIAENRKDFASIAGKLVELGYQSGSKDNISAGVFKVKKGLCQGLAVADGHGFDGVDIAENVAKNYFLVLEKEIAKELALENIITPESASVISMRK